MISFNIDVDFKTACKPLQNPKEKHARRVDAQIGLVDRPPDES